MIKNMKLGKGNLFHLLFFASIICIELHICVGIGNSQDKTPIIMENLISALKDCKKRRYCKRCQRCELKASDFILQININKVDFTLNDLDAQKIREAGNFFVKKELDDLILTIRSSYDYYYVTEKGKKDTLETMANRMKLTLLDSYGEAAIDEKIRLIHVSINTALRLDTNYKFYDGFQPNIFTISGIDKNHLDGTVFFGREFIKQNLITDTNSSQLASDSVLYFLIAHSTSTLKQNKIGWSLPPNKKRTLHADFIAGWWVNRFLKTTKNGDPEYQAAFFGVLKTAFRYGVDNPLIILSGTHGTPKERLDAVSAGFNLATEADVDVVYQKGIEYVQRL